MGAGFNALHDVPLSVTLLDVRTGRTAPGPAGYGAWWWTEGNGACDCNREAAFVADAPLRDHCAGKVRYVVVGVSPMPDGYTLADFNRGYPAGVVPTPAGVTR